jgi:hypothetical protein
MWLFRSVCHHFDTIWNLNSRRLIYTRAEFTADPYQIKLPSTFLTPIDWKPAPAHFNACLFVQFPASRPRRSAHNYTVSNHKIITHRQREAHKQQIIQEHRTATLGELPQHFAKSWNCIDYIPMFHVGLNEWHVFQEKTFQFGSLKSS